MDKLLRMLAALLTMFAMTVFSTSCSDDYAKTEDAKNIVTISVNNHLQVSLFICSNQTLSIAMDLID